MKDRQTVRTLVEKIPEDILRRTTFWKKKASFKEEADYLGPRSRKTGRMTQRRVVMTKTVCPRF